MNQNQKNDRKLIAWTTLLLCAEVVWLLLHMQILPNSFFQNSSASETLPAGTIQITQHEVRRRNLNSLVWENSEPQDTIYFYDSILTLSQSSATLALEQQTEIHLSENTLVTIEPQEQASNDQIRLRFSHGDLRARNPLQTAKIEATEWNLNIQKGSEMNLRQTGEQDYEVEVLKGHLQVQSAEGTKSLGQNEVLKINNNKLGETLALEKDLQFSGTPSERIYSAEENVTVPIAWKGNADKIEIIRQGQKSEEKSLRPDQLSENLPLTFGKYTLRLMKDGKVSAAKEIEIWKTPVIQLLSPFPRDRVKTDESIVFVWSHVPEVAKYQFVIKDLDTKDSVDNFMFYTFNKEGHFEWTVQGRDQDGFLIPPSYFNQIYSLNNPLAAPKLKSPSLRKPAGKKTDKATDKKNHQSSWHKKMFWLSFFLPAAQAQETHEQNDYEAVFDWESVDGADQYTIEISDTADFRKPRVSETVKQTEFVWSQFPLGTYYWRVAGQTRRGRLGLFSEAAKVNLTQVAENPTAHEGVVIRKKIDTTDKEVSSKVSKPAVTNDDARLEKAELASEQTRNLKDSYLLAWTPSYSQWSLQNDDVKGKYSGSSLGALLFQTEQTLSPEKSYLLNFSYEQATWQATDKTTYPFQKDLSYTHLEADIWFANNHSRWLHGGVVETIPVLTRDGNESVKLDNQLAAGYSALHLWGEDHWKNETSLNALIGSSTFAFSNQNHFKYHFHQDGHFFIGAELGATLYFHGKDFNDGWSAGLMLGYH